MAIADKVLIDDFATGLCRVIFIQRTGDRREAYMTEKGYLDLLLKQ